MQHKYFAASNSSEGFKSYFGGVFDRAERLYIIKGGPGTGKSSLMKRVAAAAEARGDLVEYYFCSSDPNSLDGVLIFAKNEVIGILDGTPPHAVEPLLPGARDEVINLGRFWNSEILRRQKNEITALGSKKSAAYRRAYSYLRSCGNLCAVSDSLLSKVTDIEKLRTAADRLVRSLELPAGVLKELPALTRAVAMTGSFRFDSIEQNSRKIWRVGDFYGVGQWFLSALLERLRTCGVTARISYDPIISGRVDGIFIEDGSLGFVLAKDGGDSGGEEEKFINPKRFVHTERLREIRGELRYAARLYGDCTDGALHALGEARVYHFLLEDIYKNAMDFASLGEFTKELLKGV